MPHLLAAACLALVAAVIGAEAAGQKGLALAAKAVASGCFVAYALVLGAPSADGGTALLAALLLSALGDVLLGVPDKRAFAAGIGAFGLAHLAFAASFAVRGVGPGAALALAPLAVAALLVWRWVGPHTGRLRPAVAAYVVVITLMVAAAAGTGEPLLLGCALMFWASDLFVARQRFVAPHPANRAVGLPLYYVAQLSFAAAYAP